MAESRKSGTPGNKGPKQKRVEEAVKKWFRVGKDLFDTLDAAYKHYEKTQRKK